MASSGSTISPIAYYSYVAPANYTDSIQCISSINNTAIVYYSYSDCSQETMMRATLLSTGYWSYVAI